MLVAVVGVLRAHADVAGAERLWNDGRYRDAFVLFLRYARLGDATSRYDVAQAYLQGRGVRENRAEAVAWLELSIADSGADGDAQSAALRDRVLALSSEEQRASAKQRFAALTVRYGAAARARRFDPVALPRSDDTVTRLLSRKGRATALLRTIGGAGCNGDVSIDFWAAMDARGRLRDLAGTAVLLRSQRTLFTDADQQCIAAVLPGALSQLQQLAFGWEEVGGEALPLLLVGKISADDIVARMHWSHAGGDLAGARAGNVAAQFGIAIQLLSGVGVERDDAKGWRWMALAEREGHTGITYLRGVHALRCGDESGAALRFAKGVEAGDMMSRRRLAWLYATSTRITSPPPDDVLALATAITLAPADLEAHDILAAALANANKFEQAQALLLGALAHAPNGSYTDEVRVRSEQCRRREPYRAPQWEWAREGYRCDLGSPDAPINEAQAPAR